MVVPFAQTLATFSCNSLICGVSFRSYFTAPVRKNKTLQVVDLQGFESGCGGGI
jgi:hypothetical protein